MNNENQNNQLSSVIFDSGNVGDHSHIRESDRYKSRQRRDLFDAHDQILATDSNDFRKHITFFHAVLCQVGLPRSQVEGQEFMRRSGNAWIHLQAGPIDEGNGPVLQPIPYGAIPRLTIAYLSTFAVQNKTMEIPIKGSAAQFLEVLGFAKSGPRYDMLRKQIHALAACTLRFGYLGRTYTGQPIQQFDAWAINKDKQEQSFWPGTIVLSTDFYNSLLETSVPLDIRSLCALRHSTLAMDIYVWLAHKLCRVSSKGTLIRWASLRKQFGQEYTGKEADKDFKDAFLAQLGNVLLAYPKARVEVVTGGIKLHNSPPPIPHIKKTFP